MQASDEQEPEAIRQAKADAFKQQIDLAAKWAEVKANQPAGHAWRKQGPHVVCMSCPTPHGHYVGLDFDTRHLTVKPMVQSGLSEDSTPSDRPDGAITPKASTEPKKRGRKKKGQ